MRQRLDQAAAVECGALAGVATYCGVAGRRGRHRAAQPFERELTVEQFGTGRGALEIGVGLAASAGGLSGAPGPIFALGQDLQRLAAAAVAIEHCTARRHNC